MFMEILLVVVVMVMVVMVGVVVVMVMVGVVMVIVGVVRTRRKPFLAKSESVSKRFAVLHLHLIRNIVF